MKLHVLVLGLVLLLATAQPVIGQTIFEDTSEATIQVYKTGDAHLQKTTRLKPSLLATTLKETVMLHPEEAKEALIEGAGSAFAQQGFEIKNAECEISGLGENENLTYVLEYDIKDFATFNYNDNTWAITFRQLTIEVAQEFLDEIKSTQNKNATLTPDAQSKSTGVMTIILPPGAQIINGSELENRTIEDNLGGGSYWRTTIHVTEVNGQAAIVKESILFVTSSEITIAPEELAGHHNGWRIIYTGVPPPTQSSAPLLYIGIGGLALTGVLVFLLLRRRGGREAWEGSLREW